MSEPTSSAPRRWFAAIFGDREMISVGYATIYRIPPSWLRAAYTLELALIICVVLLMWRICDKIDTLTSLLRNQ